MGGIVHCGLWLAQTINFQFVFAIPTTWVLTFRAKGSTVQTSTAKYTLNIVCLRSEKPTQPVEAMAQTLPEPSLPRPAAGERCR